MVFEILLSEWHLAPDYIVSHWSTEMMSLMLDKLVERKQAAMACYSSPVVSDEQLFSQAGIKVTKVKHGD